MPRWTFGDFVLDLDTRLLTRGGAPVSLSPKALQLLGILVDSHPTALSKAQLQDRLWPGTFVVEKNLTNLVSEVREALADDAAQPRFIRTVHRFGYAFREPVVGDVRETARHNLPAQLTNFVGREREIAELLSLIASARLMTLTGAGGCGKTRLALQLAARALDRFPDGVWMIDLAGLRFATEGQLAARASPDPTVLGPALSCLAYAALHEGDFDRAGRLHEEILEQSRRQGDKWAIGIVLFDLALLRVVQGRLDEARALCDEGIALYREFGDRRGVAWCLGILSGADAAEGRARRAALLRGAMEGLLESVGAPVQVSYDTRIGDRGLASMKASLGDDACHAAVAEGRTMSLSRAIQLALHE